MLLDDDYDDEEEDGEDVDRSKSSRMTGMTGYSRLRKNKTFREDGENFSYDSDKHE